MPCPDPPAISKWLPPSEYFLGCSKWHRGLWNQQGSVCSHRGPEQCRLVASFRHISGSPQNLSHSSNRDPNPEMNKGKSLWLLKSALPGSFCLQGVFSPWGSSAPQEEGILANSPTNLAAMLTWDWQSGDIKLPCSMDASHKQHTSMQDGAAVLAACSHLKCVKLNDPPTCC